MVSVVTVAALLLHPSFVTAAEVRPGQLTTRIRAIQKALDRLATALDAVEHRLDEAEVAAARHRRAVAGARERQQVLREALGGRAADLYTMGGGLLETLLGARDVSELVDRYAYLEEIRAAERAMLEELAALRRRAGTESAELAHAVGDARRAREELVSRQRELGAKLREYKSLLNLLAVAGGRYTVRASRGPTGFVCPVAGPNVVTNNYGDPRPGGPHTGIDIRADYGTPVVAVLPSRVVGSPSGWAYGIAVIIRDGLGNEWWYAHLSREFVSVGQRLAAGQLIGRVGCSGRCYGPHLHFEYHPGGGAPANPYRILRSAC